MFESCEVFSDYYRRFVEGYAKLAWPLMESLKREGFHWNENAEAAFHQLKTAMAKVPVLTGPNFS